MSFIYSLISSILVSLVSFVGILLFFRQLGKKRLVISGLIAFAAGALIGDALLHLLGEFINDNGYSVDMIISVFLGILLMMVIEAYFHCSHDSEDELEHHKIAAKNNLIGDSIHNFLDGIAIASSYLVNPAVGITSTIAIILHEIPQEFADAGILLQSGWRIRKVFIANFLTALTAVLGVIVVFILKNSISGIESLLIPLAAGQFIYISLADLVPEIHYKKNVPRYLVEIGAFILGFVIMYLLLFVE